MVGSLPNEFAFNLDVFHNLGLAPHCCLGKVQGCAVGVYSPLRGWGRMLVVLMEVLPSQSHR